MELNPEEMDILETFIAEMNEATDRAERAINETLAYVEASNRRIDAMERAAAALLKRLS